jgi:hypothetical protein
MIRSAPVLDSLPIFSMWESGGNGGANDRIEKEWVRFAIASIRFRQL